MKTDMDLEQALLKQRILSQNNTFKTAFSATLGFYAAQFVATLMGLATFAVIGTVIYLIFKSRS